MDSRTREILEAVISEFIETGEPVSSGKLYKKYRFDVKPATIRHELNLLDTEAFLKQPHTSSGRVPTDKGYKFFVEQVLSDSLDRIEQMQSARIEALRSALHKGKLDTFIDSVADRLKAVSVGYTSKGGIHKSGLHELVDDLVTHNEIGDIHEVSQIVQDFELLDERIEDLLNFLPKDKPSVFIGKSPITKSPHLSVIADKFDLQGKPTVVAIVGSKRMDYEGNIGFFITLKENIK